MANDEVIYNKHQRCESRSVKKCMGEGDSVLLVGKNGNLHTICLHNQLPRKVAHGHLMHYARSCSPGGGGAGCSLGGEDALPEGKSPFASRVLANPIAYKHRLCPGALGNPNDRCRQQHLSCRRRQSGEGSGQGQRQRRQRWQRVWEGRGESNTSPRPRRVHSPPLDFLVY